MTKKQAPWLPSEVTTIEEGIAYFESILPTLKAQKESARRSKQHIGAAYERGQIRGAEAALLVLRAIKEASK